VRDWRFWPEGEARRRAGAAAAPGGLAAWLARAGGLAWVDAAAADGVHGGGQARAKAGVGGRPLCCSGSGTGYGGGHTRLCRATDQSAALQRHGSGRDTAAPRSVAR